jgi:hypothetical protein
VGIGRFPDTLDPALAVLFEFYFSWMDLYNFDPIADFALAVDLVAQ